MIDDWLEAAYEERSAPTIEELDNDDYYWEDEDE